MKTRFFPFKTQWFYAAYIFLSNKYNKKRFLNKHCEETQIQRVKILNKDKKR